MGPPPEMKTVPECGSSDMPSQFLATSKLCSSFSVLRSITLTRVIVPAGGIDEQLCRRR